MTFTSVVPPSKLHFWSPLALFHTDSPPPLPDNPTPFSEPTVLPLTAVCFHSTKIAFLLLFLLMSSFSFSFQNDRRTPVGLIFPKLVFEVVFFFESVLRLPPVARLVPPCQVFSSPFLELLSPASVNDFFFRYFHRRIRTIPWFETTGTAKTIAPWSCCAPFVPRTPIW